MTTAFDNAFKAIVGEEGGYTNNPADPGNWTGGKVGEGELRGTKYGISAAAYPTLDIANLALDQAKAIYKPDYWDKVRGDDLPPTLALLAFDAAVNNGVSRAGRWLQAAVGVAQDGALGPITIAAVEAHRGNGAAVQAEFLAQRTVFMASLPTWKTFGLGWARRLATLPYLTAEMLP